MLRHIEIRYDIKFTRNKITRRQIIREQYRYVVLKKKKITHDFILFGPKKLLKLLKAIKNYKNVTFLTLQKMKTKLNTFITHKANVLSCVAVHGCSNILTFVARQLARFV